ncbi:MAG: hypothetical protein KME15_19920 [Drouetiella hepatica Uher 2000/2452]|jgi:hypothetical protein|uniref:Uncharacterized protein n=1 Tax=Drouetiella hepatica Uher 2000/2452 TaxID=904376 RepID=A0A951UPL2_9CYAN|nr:hypothetical protein [Drouetiella hepatica Uher 2000/2452]
MKRLIDPFLSRFRWYRRARGGVWAWVHNLNTGKRSGWVRLADHLPLFPYPTPGIREVERHH